MSKPRSLFLAALAALILASTASAAQASMTEREWTVRTGGYLARMANQLHRNYIAAIRACGVRGTFDCKRPYYIRDFMAIAHTYRSIGDLVSIHKMSAFPHGNTAWNIYDNVGQASGDIPVDWGQHQSPRLWVRDLDRAGYAYNALNAANGLAGPHVIVSTY